MNILFALLAIGGWSIVFSKPEELPIALPMAILFSLLFCATLAFSLISIFKAEKVLIVQEDRVCIPTMKSEKFRDIYFRDVHQVLITYDNVGQVVQMKLKLTSGRTIRMPKDYFQDEKAFEECAILVNDLVNAY
ncbi:MAG: hypothetical protein AAGN35_17435 [Bacteroidota bacterium]